MLTGNRTLSKDEKQRHYRKPISRNGRYLNQRHSSFLTFLPEPCFDKTLKLFSNKFYIYFYQPLYVLFFSRSCILQWFPRNDKIILNYFSDHRNFLCFLGPEFINSLNIRRKGIAEFLDYLSAGKPYFLLDYVFIS